MIMMKIFSSLSISRKIAAVFIFLLFMMGIGGLVGLYNARQIVNVTESLYTDSFKRSETLSSVENEFLSARQELFLHAIISDETSKTYLEGLIEGHRKKIDRLLDEYEKLGFSSGQKAIFNELDRSLSEYWTISGRITASSLKGERQASLNLIRTAGNDSFTTVFNALKKLSVMERDSALIAYQKSNFFAGIIVKVTVAFTLAALVLAAGLWIILTRSIVRPILAIEESAKKIGQGMIDQRVPVATEDEIGSLAIEFNKMSESLKNYYATLEKKVAERTEELKAANDELVEKKRTLEFANMELIEANAIKSQFLANVSHELRTPLNSIIGFSELLIEKAFGDLNERQTQYVEFVHSSGGHLLQLINNILDLSKIEAGRMGVVMEDFPILETIGEILGILKPVAHQRNITIESKTAIASPMIRADKVKFKQILLNLLNNAVKFNVDGGKIAVDWEIVEEPSGMKMERFYIFKIRDTGIGVRQEDIPKLFKEFEQIDSSFSREYGGTGLGLALIKRLVEIHKGSVWVESEPGVGSTFYVKMPKGTEDIDVPSPAPVPTQTGDASSQDADDRPLVLIASESPDINRLLEIYLESGYYDVAIASDGIDLLRKARELKPFAIVMGISIPKKDGWEALNDLKSDSNTREIPVVVISSTENHDLAYALGAAEYLQKPINKEGLLKMLWRLRSASRASKGGLKILIAVEDFDGVKDASDFLEKEGFSVFRARAGDAAMALARDIRPDVVIHRLKLDGGVDLGFIRDLGAAASAKKTIVLARKGLTQEDKRLLGAGVKVIEHKDGFFSETLLSEIRSAGAA